MPERNHFTLSQILCSRLCHDLITPIGAIMSGMELMEDHPSDSEEIIQLVQKSAFEAARRLSFFRLTFGQGVINNLNSLSQIKEYLEKSLDKNKITFQWHISDSWDTQLPQWGRLVSCLAFCAVETAPSGGNLTIQVINKELQVDISAEQITFPEDLPIVFKEGLKINEITPRFFPAYMAWYLAKELQHFIQLTHQGSTLKFKVVQHR